MKCLDGRMGKHKDIVRYITNRIHYSKDVQKERKKMLEEVDRMLRYIIRSEAIVRIMQNKEEEEE